MRDAFDSHLLARWSRSDRNRRSSNEERVSHRETGNKYQYSMMNDQLERERNVWEAAHLMRTGGQKNRGTRWRGDLRCDREPNYLTSNRKGPNRRSAQGHCQVVAEARWRFVVTSSISAEGVVIQPRPFGTDVIGVAVTTSTGGTEDRSLSFFSRARISSKYGWCKACFAVRR